MNAKTITTTMIAAVLGFSLGMPAVSLAGDDGRKYRHGYAHHDDRGYRHHKRDYRHHKREWREHRRNHYKHHRKHHSKHHYKHHRKHHYSRRHYNNHYYKDDDDHEKLLIGLVVGGLIGYALNENRHNESYYDNSYQRSPTYPAEPVRHTSGTCLQEREYQTTVIVGGREVDAYGTACLQPDGSWKRSPARLASY